MSRGYSRLFPIWNVASHLWWWCNTREQPRDDTASEQAFVTTPGTFYNIGTAKTAQRDGGKLTAEAGSG